MHRDHESSTTRATCPVIGRWRGLTLVELLTSAAAVALLVAALTPALAGVRGRSKQTVCLQNLARIAEGSIVYATADEDDQAVPIHPTMLRASEAPPLRRQVAAMAWGGKSGRGAEDGDPWFWGTFKSRGPSTRPLNRVLFGDVFPNYAANPGPGGVNWLNDERLDLSVYRCPSDNGYTGLHHPAWRDSGLTSFDHYGNSYAANVLFVFVSGGGNCQGQPCCDSNSPLLQRLGDIPAPGRTIYYLENCGRFAFWADPQGDGSCGSSPFPGAVVNGWHEQPWLFNVAFADGHAGPINMRGHQKPRLWHYPGTGGFPDAWQFWRCVITRGDDWQLDTLPLEPVATSLPCSTAREDID
ncbi:MAG: hypothetical protein GY778_05845 [bacterium]|nr:hypothetical protein [bacterium]